MEIHGIIVPLLTPLQPDESLDEAGLERLIEHVIEGGVAAIFVVGTSGEFPALAPAVKERLVRATCAIVSGRVPVLAGVAEPGTRLAIAQAQRMAKLGIDGVVVTAPYYFLHPQNEISHHFSAVANAVDVPTIVYNIPQTVQTIVEPETIAELIQLSGIVGIKDSAGDMARFQEFLNLRVASSTFQVWQGAEALAAVSVVRGADGAVLGLANIAPRLCHDLYQAARDGDLVFAWAMHDKLMKLFTIQNHQSFLAGLKTAASHLGLCGRTVTAPFRPLDEAQAAQVRQTLIELSLLPAAS
jgi:4-hydroxy-tetrahydrodipicolinate synthase